MSTAIILMVGLTFAFIYPHNYFAIVRNLDIFAGVYKEVNAYYVDDINPTKLMNKGIEAMLASLDPYTVYISEDQIEDYRTLNTGQYAGIGATTVRINNHVYIAMIFNGYPAQKCGLRIGDEIIKIDNRIIKGMTPEELNQLVKGQVQSQVSFEVLRPGEDQPLSFTLKREKVVVPNVPYSGMIAADIGYIKFTEFTSGGSKNIRNAVEKLEKQGATALVLDLRSNPGGILQEAVSITNLFIPKGREVVRTIGKVSENNHIYYSEMQPLDENIPLVVLINSRSASASEIVSGALQDYDRAVILGQKSYGKGLVQLYRNLPYKSQMKITVAKYYIPSGRCIQAVDYSHRNPDGSVGKIPDSLKVAFKTKDGRTVYDGGGIDPDEVMQQQNHPSLAQALVNQGILFRYGTRYELSHHSIAPASKFDLTDNEYNEFTDWVLHQKDFSFHNQLQDYISRVQEAAVVEKKERVINSTLDSIATKTDLPLRALLIKHKTAIKNLLEVEIASRYYYQKGVVEAGIGNDAEVNEAKAILHDPAKYRTLLGKN